MMFNEIKDENRRSVTGRNEVFPVRVQEMSGGRGRKTHTFVQSQHTQVVFK